MNSNGYNPNPQNSGAFMDQQDAYGAPSGGAPYSYGAQPLPQQMPGTSQGMPPYVDPHPQVRPKPNKAAMIISYIISGIGSLVLFASIFLFVAIMAPQLFGIKPYAVTSGSMEPNFPVGCLVYVQDTNPGELEVNDVISFDKAVPGQTGTVVTHRIVQKDPTDREFVTKGDANESNDPTRVSYDAVIGKVVFGVPLVGYIAMATETWDGKVAMIAIIVGAMIICLVGDQIRRHARKVARKKAVFEQPY